MHILKTILGFICALFLSRSAPAAENLALRQQLVVLRRSVKRPKFRRADRIKSSSPQGRLGKIHT